MTGVASLLVMKTHADKHKRIASTSDKTSKGLVVAGRPTVADRLAARWRSRRLDRALARGISPEAGPALALRARHLTELRRRRAIAGALRRVVRDAGRPSYARIAPDRSRVEAARSELSLLADAIAAPGPVAAPGVAQALILLTDGTGPLYNPGSGASLKAGAARAARELRPWPA